MRKNKIFLAFIFVFMVIQSTKLEAEIDYASEEVKYEALCATKSGFSDNKVACTGYENYVKNKISDAEAQSKDLSDRIAQNQGDINNLSVLIKENEKLITEKEADITTTKKAIEAKEAEIVKIEDTIIDRIALMQEVNIETVVYDFAMGSISLDQLLTQISALNAVNESSKMLVDDLDLIKANLETTKTTLVAQQDELKVSKQNQENMIIELKTKEAEMMEELSNVENVKKTYDSKIDNINVGIIPASPGFITPVASAWVTAVAWYYPASFGGGWHPGIDLANPSQPPIVAPANGIVLVSVTNYGSTGYGNYAVTAHQVGDDTYTFIYGHMLETPAAAGTLLNSGDQIGIMGNTGFSTGTHLHFEVFKHTGKTLEQVVAEYQSTHDYNFGLGYNGVGNCGSVCRIAPQDFLGVQLGQHY